MRDLNVYAGLRAEAEALSGLPLFVEVLLGEFLLYRAKKDADRHGEGLPTDRGSGVCEIDAWIDDNAQPGLRQSAKKRICADSSIAYRQKNQVAACSPSSKRLRS